MKKPTKIIIGVIAGLIIIGALSDNSNNSENYNDSTEPVVKVEESVEEKTETKVEEPSEKVEEVKEDIPFEHKQALKQAQNYIDILEYSEQDLKRQLEYHEYSAEAIQYALENVKVDYQQECIEQAKDYLEIFAYSESDLRQQLEYHGYSAEHIEQAIQETYR